MKTNESNMETGLADRIMDKLCLTPAAIAGIILLVIIPFIPPFNQEYMIRWLVAAALIGANAIAFDFTTGYINIVNFGYYAFLGFGGYTSAILAVNLGISPWIGMFVGAIFSGFLGFLTGLLTLRLRGIFAACMAWFLGLAMMGLVTKMVWLTRGPLGLRCPQLFDTSANLPYYYLILFLMLIIYISTKWVTRSDMGLAFKAIGQNMEAARTSGINPVFYRIVNFTLSCTIAGLLGGFYAHYYGVLTPELLHTTKTVEVLAVAYIGGRGSLWGGAFIAFPFIIAMELVRSSLSELPGLNLIIYGLLLMWVMIYYPGGFAHFFNTHLAKPKNRFLRYCLTRQ
jgi:branched-chain amino acid transport system permease protein